MTNFVLFALQFTMGGEGNPLGGMSHEEQIQVLGKFRSTIPSDGLA